MRKIIGIGESVLDIVFKNNQPQSANPGGSAFNSMIAIGRCGIPCCFLTELGDDSVAKLTREFMEQNGVDSQYVTQIPHSKSRISLAFLNEQNDAHYQFYKDPEPDNLVYRFPDIQKGDYVLMSSFYAVNPSIRYRVQPFLKHASEAGAFIYYDVNFRPSHAGSVQAVLPSVEENFALAHIVRGSVDDFKVLYGLEDPDEIYGQKVAPFCTRLILSDGPNPVRVYAPGIRLKFEVPDIQTVSTIGAGDNFNSGVLYFLYKQGISVSELNLLTAEKWTSLVAQAEEFSTEVCQSLENYISKAFGDKKRK